MAYTNTKTWNGNFWAVTSTTVLISNVTGKVSFQNMLSLVRINILLSKVSKPCILKKCGFPWNTNRRRCITLSLWNQWSVQRFIVILWEYVLHLKKYSKVFVSKMEFGKRTISCPVQDLIPRSLSLLQNSGVSYELSNKTEKNFFREECAS